MFCGTLGWKNNSGAKDIFANITDENYDYDNNIGGDNHIRHQSIMLHFFFLHQSFFIHSFSNTEAAKHNRAAENESVSILSGLPCRILEHQIFPKFSYNLLWKPYRWLFIWWYFVDDMLQKFSEPNVLPKFSPIKIFQSVRVFHFCLKRFAAKFCSTIYKKNMSPVCFY